MSVIVIPIDATGADVRVKEHTNVHVGDEVRWTLIPETAAATVTFRCPALVRMVRDNADQSQPAEAVILAKPGQNESLKYDVAVTDKAWSEIRRCTAELIIAVEISNLDSQANA